MRSDNIESNTKLNRNNWFAVNMGLVLLSIYLEDTTVIKIWLKMGGEGGRLCTLISIIIKVNTHNTRWHPSDMRKEQIGLGSLGGGESYGSSAPVIPSFHMFESM